MRQRRCARAARVLRLTRIRAVGFPNGDMLAIWNCREASDAPACTVAGPTYDAVFYASSTVVFGDTKRYWYLPQADGTPAPTSFFVSSADNATVRMQACRGVQFELTQCRGAPR